MAKAKKELTPSEDWTKKPDGELADKIGYLSAAIAQPMTDLEIIKGVLKNRAIAKITVEPGDTAETLGTKLAAAGNAGLFKGKLFEVNVFPQTNTQTDVPAMKAKLEELMTAPGQFTRFMNRVITKTIKWVAKPSVLKAALVPPPAQPGEERAA